MIGSASSGIGYLLVPPLMEYLIQSYSWQGAMQIISAIIANICVCGVLLSSTPLRIGATPPTKTTKLSSSSSAVSSDMDVPDNRGKLSDFFRDVFDDFDLGLFRNVRFVFQSIIGGLLLGAMNTFGVYIFPAAVSIGISTRNASLLMLVYGVLILATRLSPISYIVDKNIISATKLCGVSNLLLGIIMIITPFGRTYAYLVAVCVGYGVTQGVAGSMITMVIAESPGVKEKAKGAIAWHIIAYGIGCLTSVFIAGKYWILIGSAQLHGDQVHSFAQGLVS